jgi:thiamine kinase-like enzyme
LSWNSHNPFISAMFELVRGMPDYSVATCFDMGVNEAQQSYLLLQDLELTHHLPPAGGDSHYGGWLSFQDVTLEQFQDVARKLARFQARWWNTPIIHREPLIAPSPGLDSLNNAGDPAAIPTQLAKLSVLRGEIPAEAEAATRQCIEQFPELYQKRLQSTESLTLMHVDFHLRSVLLPNDTTEPQHSEPMIIDWETVQRGIGVSDIANLLLASMLPLDQYRSIQDPVIEAYHDELLASGVSDYSLEDCREDYRLSVIGLVAMVVAPPFARSAWFAFEWLDCAELLED